MTTKKIQSVATFAACSADRLISSIKFVSALMLQHILTPKWPDMSIANGSQNDIHHCSKNNMTGAAYQQQAYRTFVIRLQCGQL